MKTYFYYLIDPRDESVKYIGQSKNPKQRLFSHITESKIKNKSYYSKKNKWIRELSELGLKPVMTVFQEFKGSVHNAHLKEWEIITDHFERGIKLLNGNDGGVPYYFSDERVKKVYKYDKNSLVLIKEYRTAFDAYSETGIKDSNIGRACKSIEKNKIQFAGGFLWSYEKFDIFPKEKIVFSVRHNKKKIISINIKTGEEIIFESAREAAKKLNCSYKEISHCCLGKQKNHNGYVFKFYKI